MEQRERTLADFTKEQRARPRLKLRLNVEFITEGQELQACRMGTTANVSAGGVYFHTAEWEGLQEGQELGLRLSGLSGYGSGPLFRDLRAKAQILRLRIPGQDAPPFAKAGVAACFSEEPCFEVERWGE